jgi:hypothetical protein
MADVDWTDEENDMIVSDYFAMLADDLPRRSYNKAEHNRRLHERIGRSRGWLEFKHANIPAALRGVVSASQSSPATCRASTFRWLWPRQWIAG